MRNGTPLDPSSLFSPSGPEPGSSSNIGFNSFEQAQAVHRQVDKSRFDFGLVSVFVSTIEFKCGFAFTPGIPLGPELASGSIVETSSFISFQDGFLQDRPLPAGPAMYGIGIPLAIREITLRPQSSLNVFQVTSRTNRIRIGFHGVPVELNSAVPATPQAKLAS
jgi:hypothetical protein